MTKLELLEKAKPILFNTEMVQAILDNRKGVTRRLIKPQPSERHKFKLGFAVSSNDKKVIGKYGWGLDKYGGEISYSKPRYKAGDYLYVRETWQEKPVEIGGGYLYKAEAKQPNYYKWSPSIHMPKEVARIFLHVTAVRVERLQDITEEQIKREGVESCKSCLYIEECENLDSARLCSLKSDFCALWDSILPRNTNRFKRPEYSWSVNPWVWVIEFERVTI